MIKQYKITQTFIITIVSFSFLFGAQIDEQLFNAGRRAENTIHAWVHFKDKGLSKGQLEDAIVQIEAEMDTHTKQRRVKTRSTHFVDEKDVPVFNEYIHRVIELGGEIRTESKWLNAVSISVTPEHLQPIADLECVEKILPVYAGKRREDIQNPISKKVVITDNAYGASFSQLEQINVIAAHNAGYTGQGIRVLMLDTGYYKDHEAIQNDKIIAEWDFINDDGETQNEPGDHQNQHNHGTYTLSTLGGRMEGVLYGPAYDAEFLLAKTEDYPNEQPIEEDWYVAGLEWGEENGADIASSSLGYIDWYTLDSLDGLTAVTTIAVNIAIENGMIVTTAAGNEGENGILAPADAFDVITCGAVDSMGNIASFSSWGPTADGRIKPEVCARGVATYCAGAYSPEHYFEADGTSFSTPLIGGACAVILSAHPDWTPLMVREALMMTANNSENPDNQYGWGVIDVMAAIHYDAFMDSSDEWNIPETFSITNPYPNPFNSAVQFSVKVLEEGRLNIDIINVQGEIVETILNDNVKKGIRDYVWDSGTTSSGMFFIRSSLQNQTFVRKICLVK